MTSEFPQPDLAITRRAAHCGIPQFLPANWDRFTGAPPEPDPQAAAGYIRKIAAGDEQP